MPTQVFDLELSACIGRMFVQTLDLVTAITVRINGPSKVFTSMGDWSVDGLWSSSGRRTEKLDADSRGDRNDDGSADDRVTNKESRTDATHNPRSSNQLK
jgi:hypothetical protein